MADQNRKGKVPVGRRSGDSSEEDVQDKEQNRTENKSNGNHEIRTDQIRIQGGNQIWESVAADVFLNSLTFSVHQGLTVGLDKQSIASIGISYYLRLSASLDVNLSLNERRRKIIEIVDMCLLSNEGAEGSS